MALNVNEVDVEGAAKNASKAYKELNQRLAREKQLAVVQRKMEMAEARLASNLFRIRAEEGEVARALMEYRPSSCRVR